VVVYFYKEFQFWFSKINRAVLVPHKNAIGIQFLPILVPIRNFKASSDLAL
jgi:hypothetical protein